MIRHKPERAFAEHRSMSASGTTRKCRDNFMMADFGAKPDMKGALSFFRVVLCVVGCSP